MQKLRNIVTNLINVSKQQVKDDETMHWKIILQDITILQDYDWKMN